MTDKELAKELDNALFHDPWIKARGESVDDLANKLVTLALEGKKRKRLEQYLPQANNLIANFINCYQKGNRWLAVDYSSDAYPGGRYKKPVTKAILVDGLIKTLQKHNLIDYKAGFYSKESLVNQGKKTRVRPVGALKIWIEEVSDAEIVQRPLGELVRVQGKGKKVYDPKTKRTRSKKELLDYDDSDLTNELRSKLKALNDFIDSAFVNVWLPAETYERAFHKCNYYQKQYYCVFNDPDFSKGGRFYGHYIQKIKKRYRPYITINHEATQELDYKGLHPNIMYNQAGAEMEGDPYLLDVDFYNNSMRKSVKSIFSIMSNCESIEQAKRAIKKKTKKGEKEKKPKIVLVDGLDVNYQIETIIEALLDKHRLIADRFFQKVPAGWALQLLDSKITMGVMLEMMLVHKAVALSIHDSFIVQSTYLNALRTAMEEVYKREIGYIPQISEFINNELKLRIDEGSSSSHSLYEQRTKQYLKNKGKVPEYPLDPPSIYPPV
jgi:hypothetical protein